VYGKGVKRHRVKRPRAGREPTSLGTVLSALRWEKRLSIRALAQKAGCNHAHLAAIETGQDRASPELIEKVANALELSADERGQLQDAARREGDPLVAPGIAVEPGKSIERQTKDDVEEVWVCAERPLEMEDRYLERVGAAIRRGIRYVYFVPSVEIWEILKNRLSGAAGRANVGSKVLAIRVADDVLRSFFFDPPFALIHLSDGDVVGIWARRGRKDPTDIAKVMEMEPDSALRRFTMLRDIVRAARDGIAAPTRRFRLLHPRQSLTTRPT